MAKVMISIPDDDLARIDAEAARRGTSRSGLMREAALRELEDRDPAAVQLAIEGTRRRLARFGVADVEAALVADRVQRDERDRRHGGRE